MARIFIVNHPHREPGYGHAKVGSTLTVSFNVSKNQKVGKPRAKILQFLQALFSNKKNFFWIRFGYGQRIYIG